MRLGNTVGSRINIFDNLELQNVEAFNNLFPECPIKDRKPDLPVLVGEVAVNNCRVVKVGDEEFVHKMYSDILYTLDRDDYYLDERDLELTEINGVPV